MKSNCTLLKLCSLDRCPDRKYFLAPSTTPRKKASSYQENPPNMSGEKIASPTNTVIQLNPSFSIFDIAKPMMTVKNVAPNKRR
jgi:hypothetical protein